MKVRNKGKVYPSPTPPLPNYTSILNLLPPTIFTLISVLSLQEKEVLAYMLTRSIKTTHVEEKRKPNNAHNTHNTHKRPCFDCECFDCYTSYWYKWDSSTNRELIHQAIEAFEEHLNNNEQSKTNSKSKRRDKSGKGVCEKQEKEDALVVEEVKEEVLEICESDDVAAGDDFPAVVRLPAASEHKGLARKVLPDVMGLFTSRLWNLWSPSA